MGQKQNKFYETVLEAADNLECRVDWISHCCLVCAVRTWVVLFIKQVFDIYLQTKVFADLVICSCIDSEEVRKLWAGCRVLDLAVILIDGTQTEAEFFGDLIVIPDREHMLGKLARALAAVGFTVEVTVADCERPLISDLTIELCFEPSDFVVQCF